MGELRPRGDFFLSLTSGSILARGRELIGTFPPAIFLLFSLPYGGSGGAGDLTRWKRSRVGNPLLICGGLPMTAVVGVASEWV